MTVMLKYALIFALVCFTLSMVFALIRILRGPAAQDRILAADALSINAMLIILTLGIDGSSVYFESALLIAIFGFVSSTAMAKFLLRGEVIEP